MFFAELSLFFNLLSSIGGSMNNSILCIRGYQISTVSFYLNFVLLLTFETRYYKIVLIKIILPAISVPNFIVIKATIRQLNESLINRMFTMLVVICCCLQACIFVHFMFLIVCICLLSFVVLNATMTQLQVCFCLHYNAMSKIIIKNKIVVVHYDSMPLPP